MNNMHTRTVADSRRKRESLWRAPRRLVYRGERRRVKRCGMTRERVQHYAEAPHVDRCGGVWHLGSVCFCHRIGEQQLWRGKVLCTGALHKWARERRGARKVGEDSLPCGADVDILDFEIYSIIEKRHAEALKLSGE